MHRTGRAPNPLLNVFGLVLAIGVLFWFFNHQVPTFLSAGTMELLARQTAIVAVAALGMTLVIISGGIDLSVGSVVALTTVVIAALLKGGVNPWIAALAGVGTGAFCGLFNGMLITGLRIAPFIATLGTFLIARGFAKQIAHNQKIDPPLSWLNDLLAAVGKEQRWMLVPSGVWLTALLAFVVAVTLKYTVLGRKIYAVGSNELATRFSGIRVEGVKLAVYLLAGVLVGVAGLLQFSRLSVGDPTVAAGMELDVIAAVVIGGASLSGGTGTVIGSLLGAVLMATIRMGCTQMGLEDWIQEVVTGGIIVLAVAIDSFRKGRSD